MLCYDTSGFFFDQRRRHQIDILLESVCLKKAAMSTYYLTTNEPDTLFEGNMLVSGNGNYFLLNQYVMLLLHSD